MQYILTEQEMNRGCEILESFETEEMTIDDACEEMKNLITQGYFTFLQCTDEEKDLCKIKVFRKNDYKL